jgi:23S rRNA U2552 (ribose-2'-O)-methylase RlmE/FtsJ
MTKPIFWEDKKGISYSAYPPTTYLTFAYWIYMVPQYKPESVLMLGFGGGTVAGLIRLLYGNVPITAIDIAPCENRYGVNLIQADAREFVKTCASYDTVIVDLFHTDYAQPCNFVGDKDFVKDLERISNYLIVNSLHTDMSAYKHLKKIGVNKASGSAEQIYYYEVKKPIKNLHPWK